MASNLAPADLLFMLEADGTIVDYYCADAAVLYVPPEVFLGHKASQVLPAEVAAAFDEALDQARVPGTPVSFQYELSMPDGQNVFEARIGQLMTAGRFIVAVQNITHGLNAKRRLREQESLLATMFAQTTDAIVLADLESGRIVEFNDAACANLGYSREEFARLSIRDIQAEHDQARIQANIEAILAGEVAGFETRHRAKDGQIQDVSVSFRLIEHQGRSLISGVWQDITERKRHEREQLARSDALLTQNRLIRDFGQSQACIDGDMAQFAAEVTETLGQTLAIERASVWLFDDAQSELHCLDLYQRSGNQHLRAERLASKDYPHELATLKANRYVDAADAMQDPRTQGYVESYLRAFDIRSMLDCLIQMRAEPRGVLRLEQVGESRDWSTDDVRFATQVADQFGIALLNSERRELVEKLRQNQEFLTRAQAVSQTGHWHLALPGNRLSWSDETYRIFGVPLGAPLTLDDFLSRVHPKDQAMVQQAWQGALAGEPYHIQHRILVNGAVRWVEERAQIEFDADHQPQAGLGIVADVTERLETSRELEDYRLHLEDLVISRTADLEAAKTAAESASRAKSAFLSNMSHEIRTPMNAILGFAHLIRRDPLSQRQAEQLDKLLASAQHLLQVINDVLDLSKIEAEKIQLEEDEFEPARVIDNVCSLVTPTLVHKELELKVDLDHLPLRLRGDSTRFGQILLNLVSNAAKFTESGEVSIVAECLDCSASTPDPDQSEPPVWVRFEVRDTGIGMSEEQLERLFQAFEQADGSTTRRYGGTGLGLAISKHLCELMGGRISVHSEPDKGSRFRVEIPFGSVAIAQDVAAAIDSLRGKRALVIEDRVEDRAMLSRLLEELGIETQTAESGALGIAAMLRDDRVGRSRDVLLIDWKMPDMDGIDTAYSIGALPLDHRPQCILVTAFGDELPLELVGAAGIARVLTKPVTPSKLRDALDHVFQQDAPGSVATSPGGATAPAGRSRPVKVLLVEDNPINQEVTRELIESLGPSVTVASNGEQAVGLAERELFDLILMDIQMPVMDGLTAARAIRRLRGRELVPILAMTANVFDSDRQRSRDAGMNDHLGKPIEPEALVREFKRWVPDALLTPQPMAGDSPSVAASPVAHPGAEVTVDLVLSRIPGLNAAVGLRRLRGDSRRYLRLLRQFAEDHRTDAVRMNALLHADDIAGLQQLAHALKGVAATLAAERIRRYAADVEQAAHNGVRPDRLRSQIEQLGLTLDAFERGLQQVAGAQDAEESIQPSPHHKHQLAEILDQLDTLLANNDTETNRVFDDARPLLRAVFGNRLTRLERRIHDFEYEQAALLLRELRQTAPPSQSSPPA